MEAISVRDIVGKSWHAVLEHFSVFFVAIFFIQTIPHTVQIQNELLGSLLAFVIAIITTPGLVILSLKIARGEKAEWKEIFDHVKKAPNYWIATIILGLIVSTGLILLIVPGIIWGLRYGLSVYIAVDEDKVGLEALRKSKTMTLNLLGKMGWIGFTLGCISLVISGLNLVILFGVTLILGSYQIPPNVIQVANAIIQLPFVALSLPLVFMGNSFLYTTIKSFREKEVVLQ